jgi:ascorbate-specific PTS system EIIC-type component UlaA
MTSDSNVNIASAWLSLKWMFYVPGDFIIGMFLNTGPGDIWGFSPESFGGWKSAVASVWVWALLASLLYLLVHMVRRARRGGQTKPTT